MRWFDEWQAIASRIDGVVRGAEVLATALSPRGQIDSLQVIAHSILPEARAIHTELDAFGKNFKAVLPSDAVEALDDYLARDWSKGLNQGQLASISPLVVLRTRFEYAVRDTEAIGRSHVELAFEHLRRLIVVDPRIRDVWTSAFDAGEVACERQGAVHLLAHGIWAFKITGAGAATDLVFPEPLQRDAAIVENAARALVLTEWKLVRDKDEVEDKASEARKQTDQYAAGVLGAIELKRTRYAVLVSQDWLTPPGDIQYRHVTIPVNPSSPSAVARRKTSN